MPCISTFKGDFKAMTEIAELQANLDQFTMVFQKENYVNWNIDCQEFEQYLLDNSSLSMNDEILNIGKLQAYNKVITLRFNGNDVKLGYNVSNPRLGFCIHFSAMAFKSLLEGLNKPAYTFYQDLYKIGLDCGYKAHLSRVDIAIDFFNQNFETNDIAKKLNSKMTIVRDHRNHVNNSYRQCIMDNSIFNTIYIGKPANSRLRIYNKQQEQLDNHGSYLSLANSVENWTRFEYELHGAYSKQFSEKLLHIRDDRSFNSLMLQTMTDRYRFTTRKGNLLSFSKLMIESIHTHTPVIFAPKTRLHTDLDKRKDWVKSNTTGVTNVLKDVNRDEGTKEVVNVLKELLMASGIEGIDITIK